MGIHVIIPARYGSSRFPGKPLVKILGRPMIQHVMERAARARGVEQVVTATDDERIKRAVEDFGGRAVMTTGELRSGSDRVAQAAQRLGLKPADLVVNVQGDQPLLPPELIELCANPFQADASVRMTTPVVPMSHPDEVEDPNHVKVVMDRDSNALYFSRRAIPHPRDGGKVTFYKHLGVYVFRRGYLEVFAGLPTGRLEEVEKLEQLRVLEAGHQLRCVITRLDSPEVDRPQDAERVAGLLQGPGHA